MFNISLPVSSTSFVNFPFFILNHLFFHSTQIFPSAILLFLINTYLQIVLLVTIIFLFIIYEILLKHYWFNLPKLLKKEDLHEVHVRNLQEPLEIKLKKVMLWLFIFLISRITKVHNLFIFLLIIDLFILLSIEVLFHFLRGFILFIVFLSIILDFSLFILIIHLFFTFIIELFRLNYSYIYHIQIIFIHFLFIIALYFLKVYLFCHFIVR